MSLTGMGTSHRWRAAYLEPRRGASGPAGNLPHAALLCLLHTTRPPGSLRAIRRLSAHSTILHRMADEYRTPLYGRRIVLKNISSNNSRGDMIAAVPCGELREPESVTMSRNKDVAHLLAVSCVTHSFQDCFKERESLMLGMTQERSCAINPDWWII